MPAQDDSMLIVPVRQGFLRAHSLANYIEERM
jgi:hypothetical protein